jgi:hypothetical protein
MFLDDFYNKKNIAEGFGDMVGNVATKVGDTLANALTKDMKPFKKDTEDSENGYSIMCGFVPPRTEPIMGSTLEPRLMIVEIWIHITTISLKK